MGRVEDFEDLRPYLRAIAYRILGTVSDAEDAVQEAWLRYQDTPVQPDSPKAFLATVITRISINELRSARARREHYVGTWLPEPLLEDPYQDPERAAELAESASMAALLLLERLSPLERAVFVLREVFDFSFTEVSSIVERSEAACRQLAVRARRHMRTDRRRFIAGEHEHQRLAERFIAALTAGDLEDLRHLLAADAQMTADGGGKAPSLPRGVSGADNMARLMVAVWPRLAGIGVSMEPRQVNAHPGILVRDPAGKVLAVLALEIGNGQIHLIRSVINPDKLAHLGPVADAWSLQEAYRRRGRA